MRILAAAALALACSSPPAAEPRAPRSACDRASAEVDRALEQERTGYLLRARESLARAASLCPTRDLSAEQKAVTDALALPSSATPSPDQQRKAILLYQDGVRLRIQNNPKVAIQRLERSYGFAPHPLTLLQLAEAHRLAGSQVQARVHVARAIHLAESRAGARIAPSLAAGHGGVVNALAITPDGRTLYSGADDGVVIAWDRSSGRERWRRAVNRLHRVEQLSLSPNGRTLLVTCNTRVYALDPRTGDLRPAPAGDRRGARRVIHLDDARLAVGMNDGTVEIWRDGAQIATLAAPERTPVLSLSTTADRGHLAVGWSNGHAGLYASGDLRQLWRTRVDSPVHAVAVGPEGERTYVAMWGGAIAVFDRGGNNLATIKANKDHTYALALFDEGRKLATGVHRVGMRVFDTQSGSMLYETPRRSSVYAIATLDDGETGAIADGTGEIGAFNFVTRQLTKTMSRGTQPFGVRFHPRGSHLATRLDDGSLVLWNLATGVPTRLRAPDHRPWFATFSPTGDRIVTVGQQGELIVWSTATGEQLRRFGDKKAELLSVAWAPDGGRLYTGDQFGRVAIWDAATGKRINRFQVHKRWITTIDVSPDGATLATGSLDSEVYLIDASTRAVLHRLDHYMELHGVRFTADGTRLATAGRDGYLRVFDVESGKLVHERATQTGHKDLSLGAGVAYAAGADRHVQTMTLSDGKEALIYGPHDDRVLSVDAHPRKPLVATGSVDRTVRLWHRDTGALLAILAISEDGSWVIATPDARVDGSSADGRMPQLTWRTGPYQLPSWAGWQRGHTPGLLAEIVQASQ